MRKIETIYHHLLYSAQKEGVYQHTQQEIANRFSYSLSTINHALTVPEHLGSLRKESKYFMVSDFKKLLYYWASIRNLEKDIFYHTFIDLPVVEIEGLIPPHSVYGCYTAAKQILHDSPADYDKVYFYTALSPADIETRFPLNSKRTANVYAIKLLPIMNQYGPFTTIPQTFVDIWNLGDWYAHDFNLALEDAMHGLLS